MRLAAFVIALLLLAGTVEATQGWLIALVVLTGIAALRPHLGDLFRLRPTLDLRLVPFVLAVLLLAGTIDPTRDWLIALSIAAGFAAFMPGIARVDGDGGHRGYARRIRREARRRWRREWRDWVDTEGW